MNCTPTLMKQIRRRENLQDMGVVDLRDEMLQSYLLD
jgi:hypothetical protein